MEEHIILVAFQVKAESLEQAHVDLLFDLERIPLIVNDDYTGVHGWWVAEDNRMDGSDEDSAIFVRKGSQKVISKLLASRMPKRKKGL